MVYIQFGDHYTICQNAKLKWPPNILVIWYRPPSSNELYLTKVCHQLEVIRNKYSNSALWIGGDANLPDIDWSTNSIQLLYTYIFLDFLHTNALIQMVYFPNRGPNILDIFITNRSCLVEECNIIGGINDHEAIFCYICCHSTITSST